MKIRSICYWTTRDGKKRRIRLFEAWCNLLGRCRGGKSKAPGKYWNAGNEFGGWEHFRQWAIASGYRKGMQLDRFDGNRAYSPDNCQWLAASVHSRKSRASHKSYCNCKMCLHPPKAIVEAILDKMKERRHDDVPF